MLQALPFRNAIAGAVVSAIAFFADASDVQARTIIDMSRQTVEVPDHVERVVTLGAVPVINSFLFALGEQSVVANGVPPELSRKIHFVFAPGLAAKPIVQGAEKGLAVETIISLQPDLVLTMDRATAESLRSLGLPVAFLQWTAPADVKAVMKFLGQVFYREQEALAYQDWFDKMIGDVTRRIDSQTASPPRVLYLNLKRLTQPHKIAEWWIPRAGGLSVTDNGRAQESFTFSIEQILAWNPQIIIVADMSERQMAFDDPRLKEVAAVRDRRVYVAPAGAHLWANRTVEQPLTVLWAATIFHPAIFGQRELRAEMARFYDRFFHIHLNDERIDEILAGSSGR